MRKNLKRRQVLSITFLLLAVVFSKWSNALPILKNDLHFRDTIIPAQLPQLPKEMSFAGEAVPLERWEIREQLEREFLLIRGETGTIFYIIKLANRWFPFIEERLTANGIPTDFKYLCIAESNLQNLVSKSLAAGFWQFLPKTAPGYNLEISRDVDERYNLAKSTDAACRYLKQAYKKFGSWTAAAASYNCGQGAYSTQAAFQQTTDYYHLDIRDETNKYIFRILSFKYLLENKEQLGYSIPASDLYPPLNTRTVTVTSSIPNLARFAIAHGTSYKMLRILNPWLRSRSLQVNGGKRYEILLPVRNVE